MIYRVSWVQTGTTEIEADTEAEARSMLTEYPFADDADAVEIDSVAPVLWPVQA